MNDFTILSAEQIFDIDKLDILKKRGIKAAVTDFAILSGTFIVSLEDMKEGFKYDYVDGANKTLANRTGEYFTSSTVEDFDDDYSMITVDYRGIKTTDNVPSDVPAVRPAINFSFLDRKNCKVTKAEDGILEVEYGHYPQQAADQKTQKELEYFFDMRTLQTTGNSFTTGKWKKPLIEYEHEGKKYVRVRAVLNSATDNPHCELSTKEICKNKDAVWVEVQPVKWWLDEKTGIMLSEKLLFSGVSVYGFSNVDKYKGNFNDSDIKQYLDEYFAKDLTQHLKKTKSISRRPSNPYGFDYSKVSEEDIIKGALVSDVPVFLHGASSDGKSSRVKQYDKDCEIIYLRNATPDSLNGKSVYNPETGEMMDVPPTWLKKLTKKCEDEQNKLHIVFFDELSNALPSIQGMAFNIVLDKEVNGKWKLPDNARIVAAGNELEDSLSANQISEPLFNRFAHVYIHTTTKDWLKWAATPKENYEKLDYEMKEPELKIHPSIYAYIALKGDAVLRTPYNGKTPNADPRKWEMASNVLYATKKPEMLRSLIGEELTNEFVDFCQQQVIGIEDVLNGNYDQDDLGMNLGRKYATAAGLSAVDEENVKPVREFVAKLGQEIEATFDNLWAHGDEHRLDIIQELRMESESKKGAK